jgi:undecaprenyl-diphosphatase
MVLLSRAGDHSVMWFGLGITGGILNPGRRRPWIASVLQIAGTEVAGRAIKRLVPRKRPALDGLPPLVPTTSPSSFPSTHTAAAVAAMAAFHGLVPSLVLDGVAVTTAFSRLYLGVHYPSDLAAGVILGATVARAWSAGASRAGARASR